MSVLEFSFLGQLNIGLGLFQLLLLLGSIFLILLILVQRGKGGGLTGALGGMGGQSAFGAKAGDAFTKVTVVTSLIWITLCMVTIALFNQPPPKTQSTTKSLIDIARDRENGVSTDDQEIDPDATGEVSIGAPDNTPEAPKEGGSDEEGASEEGASEESGEPEGSAEDVTSEEGAPEIAISDADEAKPELEIEMEEAKSEDTAAE